MVVVYTRNWCMYCVRAKRLLDDLGVKYQEISVDGNAGALQEMMEKSQRRTVPQIWIGAFHVGGCDDLLGLHRSGKLVPLLSADMAQS